jgi:ATP-dependent DNA ligase
VKKRRYEGLVGKDPESTYCSGPSRAWLKLKLRHDGARRRFASSAAGA